MALPIVKFHVNTTGSRRSVFDYIIIMSNDIIHNSESEVSQGSEFIDGSDQVQYLYYDIHHHVMYYIIG